jgi:hypothetical protein
MKFCLTRKGNKYERCDALAIMGNEGYCIRLHKKLIRATDIKDGIEYKTWRAGDCLKKGNK